MGKGAYNMKLANSTHPVEVSLSQVEQLMRALGVSLGAEGGRLVVEYGGERFIVQGDELPRFLEEDRLILVE